MVGKKHTPEASALDGLLHGKLDGLAELLRSQLLKAVTHGAPFALPPMIGFELLNLIDGDADSTSHRLTVARHPDLQKGSHTIANKLAADESSLGIALAMARHGALNTGQVESACAAVMAETSKGRRTVLGHWSKHKEFLEAIENGTLFSE